jgi:N-terminal domain of Peptidase_S41 in eukaryotic IRBP
MSASRMELNEAMPSDSQSTALLPPDSSPRPEALPPQLLDAAERKRLMNAVIDNLRQHYIDPQVARKMADALLAHNKNGDDDEVTDGRAFADLLTRQLREVSHDMHLEVVYSQSPLPDLLTEPSLEDRARCRRELEQDNCTFKKSRDPAEQYRLSKAECFSRTFYVPGDGEGSNGFLEPSGRNHL